MLQILTFVSILLHRALSASPVLAAVRIRNWSALRCRSLLLAQTQQEGWQVAIWHGSVVNDLLGLARFREEVIEVPAPARRVLAVAVASRVPVSILSIHNA
jgi:hypothetical protein